MSISSPETAKSGRSWPGSLLVFLVTPAALPLTSQQRWPCACIKLVLQFAKLWPGRFLCQGGRGARMTPGIKRLYHWAGPSLPALSVPIHDGTDYSVVSRIFCTNVSPIQENV